MNSPEIPYEYPILEFKRGTVSQEKAELLSKKLLEYRKRLSFAKNQETVSIENLIMNAITSYKFVLLKTLMEEGRADPFSLRIELERKLGPNFHEGSFEHAWRVIDDYCKTGGVNSIGGTGLDGAGRTVVKNEIPNTSPNSPRIPDDTIVHPLFSARTDKG